MTTALDNGCDCSRARQRTASAPWANAREAEDRGCGPPGV